MTRTGPSSHGELPKRSLAHGFTTTSTSARARRSTWSPTRHAHGHQHRRPSGRTPVGSQRFSGSWSGPRPQWRWVSRWRSTQLEWSSCAVTAANSAALQAGKPRSCGPAVSATISSSAVSGGVDCSTAPVVGRRPVAARVRAASKCRPDAVEREHGHVGSLAVDDLLHAQRVARVQRHADPGARGDDLVDAGRRVAGRRRAPGRPGASRLGSADARRRGRSRQRQARRVRPGGRAARASRRRPRAAGR